MYVCVYLSMHMYVYVCVCRHVLHMCVVLRNESQAFPMLHSALLLSYSPSSCLTFYYKIGSHYIAQTSLKFTLYQTSLKLKVPLASAF